MVFGIVLKMLNLKLTFNGIVFVSGDQATNMR